ncbi:ferredoxin [Micromonospora sp. C95]|uniref:ferredoxin n=1 Tax=Micromonospora sp. C95 TaxID=2824882 RepID=UPI001B39C1F9|nr:ferredoxin [Micromonospora sp. C95]MBQ1023719.1 ferredoxin [Micromonospora sp. C95]
MKIEVDQEKCCGAGQCALIAPEVFAQRDDRIVVLLVPVPDESLHDPVRDAAEACPMSAITLLEDVPVSG